MNNNSSYRQADPVSPLSPPEPPSHQHSDGRAWAPDNGYAGRQYQQQQRPPPLSNITPGADNFSESAAGGMAGIAYSVADRNARESGMEAMRGLDYPPQAHQQGHSHGYGQDQWHKQPAGRRRSPDNYRDDAYNHPQNAHGAQGYRPDRDSQSSMSGLGAGAGNVGMATPGVRTPSRSPHAFGNEVYTDDPYQDYGRPQDPRLGVVNPNDIEDDGDEGLVYNQRGPRTSMLSLNGSGHRGRDGAVAAGAVAGAAGAAGVMSAMRNAAPGRNAPPPGGYYGPVNNASTAYQGAGAVGKNASAFDSGSIGGHDQPSEWLEKQQKGSKKWKWAIAIGVVLLVGAAVALGIVFGVVLKKNNGTSGGDNNSQTAAGDAKANGDLSIDSPEIKGLLNNGNLHKVFPGVDYTPVNTQYPDCLLNPPSQNNVTRDIAVLSQLTNTIRLYGTDCNQTEMTIHAINQLKMQDTVKIWMGVWQDNNATTNKRQLDQMWTILDKYGAKPFKGIIVANEILFRQQMTSWELSQLLSTVRTNLTAKGMTLPVATSDLGNNWTPALAQASDYVMANIHPFFAGVDAKIAAAWTSNFWQTNNGPVFKSDISKNIISETGWPTQGGTDCGSDTVTSCAAGSVAGIDQLNQFMSDWVCSALKNGTQYFWFEAFDEPWKISFDSPGHNWEDHWGLMDVNRNLKSGVKIPDCGGQTV
jgi:exo-beta-1,3-glucanase (GH17 family)